MTHKIQKMLAKNYIEQAKKNRKKAWLRSLFALLCSGCMFYSALYELQTHYGGRWFVGSVIATFFSMLYAAIAWVKTDPVQLVPRKDVIPIAKTIFRYNESTIKRLIGMAVWGKDQEIPLLSTVTFNLDDNYPFEPVMVYNLDAPVPNWDITSLKIYLQANDMVIKVQIQAENNIHYPSPKNAVNKRTIQKDMRISLPLTAESYPLEYKELATMQ